MPCEIGFSCDCWFWLVKLCGWLGEAGSSELEVYLDLSLAKDVVIVLPGHSTVDGKVERVGKANESIDDENNVLDNIVINETEAETRIHH